MQRKENMKRIITKKVPFIHLEKKYDDIESWFFQKITSIKEAKRLYSVSGYTAIPFAYEKAQDFYGYNVKYKVIKCNKIKLSEQRKKEIGWLIELENKEYGLTHPS